MATANGELHYAAREPYAIGATMNVTTAVTPCGVPLAGQQHVIIVIIYAHHIAAAGHVNHAVLSSQ